MYKILQQLEDVNLLDKLVKQGIVSITIAGHKMIYEVYLKELKTVKKAQAITNTSIDTKTPERTIYRIIKVMEDSK
jgi:hypothetical protein